MVLRPYAMAQVDSEVSLPPDFFNEHRLLALALIHMHEKLEHPLYGVWGPFLAKCVRPPPDKFDVLVVTYAQALVNGTLDVSEQAVMVPGKFIMMIRLSVKL